ncbi:MAG: hypothetical protein BWK80_17190 [Desulfobacteraceae bacterium IS3]|nr:MAG: hypothetical protein BWK80_17190 [Desulfobacteraceae bacterium IS3]HAO22043.1 hypothetical protein [Desulfobacteraceae bacterium]
MEFKEKLAKLAEKNKTHVQKLEQDKITWIREVKKLYEDIENWLKESIDCGHIVAEYYSLQHIEYEEFIEQLFIMELTLGGGPCVVLEPTGINIIGAFGKIDLYLRGHKEEKIMLLLIERQKNELRWELWKNNKDHNKSPFNKDTFEKLLSEWIDKTDKISEE